MPRLRVNAPAPKHYMSLAAQLLEEDLAPLEHLSPTPIQDPEIEIQRLSLLNKFQQNSGQMTWADVRRFHLIKTYFAKAKPIKMPQEEFDELRMYVRQIVLGHSIADSSGGALCALEVMYENYLTKA
jgi:hypothetical protein